ncbi:MAG: iron chaperone [Acidimicrobiales bacterium]
MTTEDVDRYLAVLEEPKRATLEEMRRRILQVIPLAEQGLSYQVPAFRVDGRVVAGLAAFKSHLSYLPHSGSVLPAAIEKTHRYTQTKSALHFPVDSPLPQELVRELIELKLREAGLR